MIHCAVNSESYALLRQSGESLIEVHMNRAELLKAIESRFRMHADGQITLDELHEYVKYIINAYSDLICDILKEVRL